MRIAFLTPELYPFAKTGGLADVSGSLTQALVELGHNVTAYMPAYPSALRAAREQGLHLTSATLPAQGPLHVTEFSYHCGLWRGVRLVLVHQPGFYDRNHPYLGEDKLDYPDNLQRFAYFCAAALTHASPEGCELMHFNDWQSSLAAAYLSQGLFTFEGSAPKSLLTIHNLGYQGLFPFEDFQQTGLDWSHFSAGEFEFYGRVNLLKGGLIHADALTAVSPTYAEEMQTPEFGHGLDGVLRSVRHKLTGILNGIDLEEWNPATDKNLPAGYSPDDLGGKARCKRELQRVLGLSVRPKSLLLGCISRLDRQKGIDLICDVLPNLLQHDVQLALLGSGSAELEERLVVLAKDYPSQVGLRLGYDESLAHLIEAGSDLFLMPSIYEPCGLNQMYSQRYGTLPVVRDTGGLRDTVEDISLDGSRGNGFVFSSATAEALTEVLRRAGMLYFTGRRSFNSLAKQAMQLDNSWASRAQQYVALYESLLVVEQPQQASAGMTVELEAV